MPRIAPSIVVESKKNILSAIWLVRFAKLTFLWNPGRSGMPTVRKAKHLFMESTTISMESGTYDVICLFCTVKGMVVESEHWKHKIVLCANLACLCTLMRTCLRTNNGELREIRTCYRPIQTECSNHYATASPNYPNMVKFRVYGEMRACGWTQKLSSDT